MHIASFTKAPAFHTPRNNCDGQMTANRNLSQRVAGGPSKESNMQGNDIAEKADPYSSLFLIELNVCWLSAYMYRQFNAIDRVDICTDLLYLFILFQLNGRFFLDNCEVLSGKFMFRRVMHNL
jgi:hypothetical protein